MASISGFGNVGGSEGYKRPSGVSRQDSDTNPQVGSDGFVASGLGAPSEEKVVLEQPKATEAPRGAETPVRTANNVPITLAMDEAHGINSINAGAGSDKIGLGAFTNGLGSNQIVGLSGRVLAGGNLFGN